MNTVSREAAALFLLLLLVGLAAPDSANAGYLDPGSGSTIVQVIIGAVAALKRWWRKVFSFGREKPRDEE